ncbi:iron ABC transporter permease [Vibrio ostreae]|uniref:Iron ABC transporter permease n=1 Tax=Vibrio ostreae TaxID=2841925 RepID=A0A975U625_9VIBR|nr:iron ABC transporter permease [Vibrio ostreae]
MMLISVSSPSARLSLFVISLVVLCGAVFASLVFGQYPVTVQQVWPAFWHPEPTSIEHVVINTIRWSRTIIAIVVGAALAIAGVLMQTLTRNPLASPAIFGVNAGAVFFIVLCSQVFAFSDMSMLFWVALFARGRSRWTGICVRQSGPRCSVSGTLSIGRRGDLCTVYGLHSRVTGDRPGRGRQRIILGCRFCFRT